MLLAATSLMGAVLFQSMLGWGGLGIGLAGIVLAMLIQSHPEPGQIDHDDIRDLAESDIMALLRGTSVKLRDMRYRYSIRPDRDGGRDRFTENVNGYRLGFVPVIILENLTERQGYGYVAFVHDGSRWCGPGLPCGGDAREAVEHASRCVGDPEDLTPPEEDEGGDPDWSHRM